MILVWCVKVEFVMVVDTTNTRQQPMCLAMLVCPYSFLGDHQCGLCELLLQSWAYSTLVWYILGSCESKVVLVAHVHAMRG